MAVRQDESGVRRRRRAKSEVDAENIGNKPGRQNLCRRAAGCDFSRLHDDELICISGGEIDVVKNSQHGDPAIGNLTRNIHQHQLMPDVEIGDWFVEQKRLKAFASPPRGELA